MVNGEYTLVRLFIQGFHRPSTLSNHESPYKDIIKGIGTTPVLFLLYCL